MEDEVCITFLRHGRSRADDEKVHEGRYDSPLTDTGRVQVQKRAQEFLSRNIRFDRIISSTLLRAHETAKIIGHVLNVAVETDADWMELDNGPLAGMPREVAAELYPKPDFRNPYEPIYNTGESEWEIYLRGARAVEKVVRRGAGSYLVVAHSAILNAALRTIVGVPPSVNQQGILFGFGDAGYGRFIYYPSKHRWYLMEFNAG